jgi:hypothetical protein
MQDPQLQKRLQQVLKLNKEKWEEARDHALKAVVVDNRMRVWWAASSPPSTSRVGVLPSHVVLPKACFPYCWFCTDELRTAGCQVSWQVYNRTILAFHSQNL